MVSNEAVLKTFEKTRIGEMFSGNEIVDRICKSNNITSSMDRSLIRPNAWCYNRTSYYDVYCECVHVFEFLKSELKYKYLGPNYPYTGDVICGDMEISEEKIIGKWINGQCEFNISETESVWIAAAVFTFNAYYKTETPTVKDMYFYGYNLLDQERYAWGYRSPFVLEMKEYIVGYKNTKYNYLVKKEKSLKRLAYPGEFNGVKERPELLEDLSINTCKGEITMDELVHFIDNQYTDLIKKNLKPVLEIKNIDLEAILKYLITYSGMKYQNPDKAGDKAEEMKKISSDGKYAREQYIDIAREANKNFPLYYMGNANNWINQAQIVPYYFWIEYKKFKYQNSKSSLSLAMEKKEDIVSFRVTVEARDIACSQEDLDKHNRLVYMPITDPNLYYSVEYKNGQYENLSCTQQELIQRYEAGKFKKVRVHMDIDEPYSNEKTNEIIMQITEAIQKLEPYYEEAVKVMEPKGVNSKIEIDPLIMQNTEVCLNTILYGPPGTGKTYNAAIYAVAIVENRKIDDVKNESYPAVLKRYNDYMENGQIVFTTFHQSYGYEEFIEGIKPSVIDADDKKDITYEIIPGVFKKFCNCPEISQIDENSNYKMNTNRVFIIDEINRGNISKIFGELITLIESSKRLGEEEALKAVLPYSGEAFGVPNNVYILGTMNTADRSIALMDTALRRRFDFIEMMPDIKVLAGLGIIKIEGIDILKMLNAINERIEYLYDREHTIGHAYFTSLAKEPTVKKLGSIFLNAILPLLQEYFYEDYSKISLVLGDNGKVDEYKFIKDDIIKVRDVFKGNPDLDLPDCRYTIQTNAFFKVESYIQIY